MPVPTNGWINGAWNKKLLQFHLLAKMLGFNTPSISSDDLQGLFRSVGSAKAFAQSIEPFLQATGKPIKAVMKDLEQIEQQLGLMQPLSFMSLHGVTPPSSFNGVAIWPTGTTNWTELRLEQILLSYKAGAGFKHIVCMNSTRVCNLPGERRHPLIKEIPEGKEPTERALQRQLAELSTLSPDMFRFSELPDKNDEGKVLSLEQQLVFLKESGQYDELIGGADIYVPSTPNSLYVPLHARRVLGHDNVWFSQAGGRIVRTVNDYWWPTEQDVLTTPSGIIRLWVELIHAGCLTNISSADLKPQI